MVVNGAASSPSLLTGARHQVATLAANPPRRLCALSISDHGTGIPTTVLGKVFEPFSPQGIGKGTASGCHRYGIVKQSGVFIFAVRRSGRARSYIIARPPRRGGSAPAPLAKVKRRKRLGDTGTICWSDERWSHRRRARLARGPKGDDREQWQERWRLEECGDEVPCSYRTVMPVNGRPDDGPQAASRTPTCRSGHVGRPGASGSRSTSPTSPSCPSRSACSNWPRRCSACWGALNNSFLCRNGCYSA